MNLIVLKRICIATLLLSLFFIGAYAVPLKGIKVLVYTKNGKGYVHDNIAASVACIQKLGRENGFKVDVSDDPAVYTDQNLKQYTILIFPSTNNDVFDTDAQRLAFRHYIEAGGSFVGLHSAVGTERNWTWFKQMLGGSFAWHPPHQKYTVRVIDPLHPTVQGLPLAWEPALGDECYFLKEFYPGIKVTAVHDISTLNPRDSVSIKKYAGSFGSLMPAEWYQRFDGGNIWITTLGHDKEYYQRADFSAHVLSGIQYIAAQSAKLDYTKAYADSRDTPVNYKPASQIKPQQHGR
jgi:type 1 glutamine amidotransferase